MELKEEANVDSEFFREEILLLVSNRIGRILWRNLQARVGGFGFTLRVLVVVEV